MENEKDLEVSQEVNVALDTDNNTQSTTVDTTTNTQTEPTQELSEQQIRIENAKKCFLSIKEGMIKKIKGDQKEGGAENERGK